jgi:hypothetical protein
MASSSSSASSAISFESESTREPTPEYDPIAAYEILTPLHWDAEEWDFQSWSEDDEPLTDGEDPSYSLVMSWRKMTKTTHPGRKISPLLQKKKPIPPHPRRIQ